MATNSSTDTVANVGGGKKKPLGFIENAKRNKGSYVQLFFMTGVMLLSMRSLGQKYRIQDLEEDNFSLRQENEEISLRMASVKKGLIHEASLDPTGAIASKLRSLFVDDQK